MRSHAASALHACGDAATTALRSCGRAHACAARTGSRRAAATRRTHASPARSLMRELADGPPCAATCGFLCCAAVPRALLRCCCLVAAATCRFVCCTCFDLLLRPRCTMLSTCRYNVAGTSRYKRRVTYHARRTHARTAAARRASALRPLRRHRCVCARHSCGTHARIGRRGLPWRARRAARRACTAAHSHAGLCATVPGRRGAAAGAGRACGRRTGLAARARARARLVLGAAAAAQLPHAGSGRAPHAPPRLERRPRRARSSAQRTRCRLHPAARGMLSRPR
jgi:hypothetical protein